MKSVATVVSAIAIAALLVIPHSATADDTPKGPGPDIAGRWVDKRKGDLTLDVSRCGDGWCGVIVNAKGQCGFRALAMKLRHPRVTDHGDNPKHHAVYNGEFRYREGSELYRVSASVQLKDGGQTGDMWIGGNPDRTPEYARMMLLNLRLVREGDGRCPAERPVS